MDFVGASESGEDGDSYLDSSVIVIEHLYLSNAASPPDIDWHRSLI
jgi:hypothetical protein